MKFIIDAHLPKSIGVFFRDLGHDTIHTSDLVLGNSTNDNEILAVAISEGAIVITKDADFYHSFLLFRKPTKLVLVKVGNLRLKELRKLFETQAASLADLLENYDLLELHVDKIIAID